MQERYRGGDLRQQRRGKTGETLGERHRLELPHQHALGGCLERLAPVLLRVEQTVDARVRVGVLDQPLFALGLQLEHLVGLGCWYGKGAGMVRVLVGLGSGLPGTPRRA